LNFLFLMSAGFVGLVHSLAPGHWLPVVLMAKTRRWKLGQAILGAVVAASGHILVSIALAFSGIELAEHMVEELEHRVEQYSGWALLVFGLAYAGWSYTRHSHCRGHTHHGPHPKGARRPYWFLLSLGFSPCVAALPVFGAAAAGGVWGLFSSLLGFALGVLTALVGSTVLVFLGGMRLDHPFLEHYGEVITGVGVALIGLLLVFQVGHWG
jgi:hypothetical protein